MPSFHIRPICALSTPLPSASDCVRRTCIVNIERYGNTTAGTIPLAMNTAVEEGKLKKGSLVLMASVGAGFTVGAALLRWAY